jgi:hypothetical protein
MARDRRRHLISIYADHLRRVRRELIAQALLREQNRRGGIL